MAPPETPADRVQALRKAFNDTVADPAFVEEAKKINMEIQPTAPDAIEKVVDDILRTPQPVIERARLLLGTQNR